MDESETKTCTNCKREIPVVNFTIHTVHCARNIKICPVCKEPVPQAELQEHHEKLHKLLPCKKCGESVCGTDLEDHIRDSCAHTIKSCRFCELELPRREIPAHEGYCGSRTEQCPDCREWVMIKYRQLHKESNHGFLRLDDDPVPQPKVDRTVPGPAFQPYQPPRDLNGFSARVPNGPSARVPNGPSARFPSGPTARPATYAGTDLHNGFVKNTNVTQDRSRGETIIPRPGPSAEPPGGSRAGERHKPPLKRTNDQPQINTDVAATEKVNKDLGMSRGAVKKRQAPKPPAALPPPDPRRDCAYYSALQRQQAEDRQRHEQTAINLAQGLPPVLNPAEKLERLRKMDALHNREAAPPPRAAPRYNPPQPAQPPQPPQPAWDDFRDIRPMSPDEFIKRFRAMQMNGPNGQSSRSNGHSSSNGDAHSNGNVANGHASNARTDDRFSEIKSSLMALRRNLNEATAPFVSGNEMNSRALDGSGSESNSDDDVRLPCEFCGRPILLDELVIHQTGCRPDLAQLKTEPRQPRRQRQRQPPLPADLPVIPCEFCTESLPVYLISEHQERCRRDGPQLYPD